MSTLVPRSKIASGSLAPASALAVSTHCCSASFSAAARTTVESPSSSFPLSPAPGKRWLSAQPNGVEKKMSKPPGNGRSRASTSGSMLSTRSATLAIRRATERGALFTIFSCTVMATSLTTRPWLCALEVQHRAQLVDDLDPIAGVRHDLIGGLIGIRALIRPRRARPVDDAGHPLVEILSGIALLRCPARKHPAGAVRGRPESLRVPPTAGDVRARTHASGDKAWATSFRVDRTLAGQPQRAPVYLHGLGVVVVGVDALDFHCFLLPHGTGQLVDEAIHHLLAVGKGERLRPVQFGDVLIEFRGALAQVGVIAVRQLDTRLGALLLGDADVLLRDLVAHSTGAGMQEAPDPAHFVDTQLNEVVAAAQGAELLAPFRGVSEVHPIAFGMLCQFRDALGSVVQVDLLVVVSWRERDRTLQLVTQGDEVQVGDVFFRVRGAGGDHTAADVHADSRRDDRPFGGDDGADSASHAEVCIRH